MYLQESQYDFGVENDPESFLQAINSCNSKLWYDAMNDELESMVNNKDIYLQLGDVSRS